MAKIIVQDTEITVLSYNDKDYISLTDMANGKQDESRAGSIKIARKSAESIKFR